MIAERRKQAIVESKFLGGDIQHTHLVKGLDYVLLDKVSLYLFMVGVVRVLLTGKRRNANQAERGRR